jgi:phospholipid/cholesterol/gamma-HCH transport system substrate-binding protein
VRVPVFSKNAHIKDTIKASVALVVCLAVLGTFVVILGGYRFWENLTYYNIRFKSVKDLSAGRPVKYGGLDVGRIISIGVDEDDPRMIRVVVGLTNTVEIRQGVMARIAQKGLVGDYYVFLDPQGDLGNPLPPNSFIASVETVDISQLAGLAGEILVDLRPRLERIAASLEQVLTGENSAKLGELLSKAPAMVEDLRKTASQIRTDFAGLAVSGKEAAETASKTLKGMEQAVGVVKKELETTLSDIRGEVKQVGVLTDTLHKAVIYDQGQLEDILANVEHLSSDLKHLAAKLRERPWEVISQPRERKP